MRYKKEDRDKNGRFVKGHSTPKEIRKKFAELLKGKRLSIKTEFKEGISPWNKGKKCPERSGEGHHFCGKSRSGKVREKISISIKKTIKNNPKLKKKYEETFFKKGIVPWNKGKNNIYSDETLKKIRQARLKQIFPKKDTKIESLCKKSLKKEG